MVLPNPMLCNEELRPFSCLYPFLFM
jgi:hypothetical protein